MSQKVILHRIARSEAVFAIDTKGHGRVTGILIGVTDDVGGQRLPGGNVAHKGIVLNKNGSAVCIPVSRSIYEKFLAEVARRRIPLEDA